jgi:hypothetical protein
MALSSKYFSVRDRVRQLFGNLPNDDERQRLLRELKREYPSKIGRPKDSQTEDGDKTRYIEDLRELAKQDLQEPNKRLSAEAISQLTLEFSQQSNEVRYQIGEFGKPLDLTLDQVRPHYHRKKKSRD